MGDEAGILSGAALADLVETGRRVVAELDLDRLAQTLADTSRMLTGAEVGAFLHEPVGGSRRSFARCAVSGARRSDFDTTVLPLLADVVVQASRGTAVLHDDLTGIGPVRSCLAVPVVGTDGEVVGVLVQGHAKLGHFDRQHEALLEGIAGFASVALANAREHRAQKEIAQALQHAMLPAIGFHEGVELAVRYRAAARRAQVGGDWYDVLRLADGRLALTVGDVAGHNVVAAARMGTVRNALSVHVLREVDPGRSLLALEEHLIATGQNGFVTAAQALFDPADASLLVARAGHLPPLLVPAEGAPRFVGGDPAPPIGVGLLQRAPETVRIELGLLDTVVFFTDGLVEQRRTATDVRMARLCELVDTIPDRTANGLCDEILTRFVDAGGADDDVAMLAIRPLFHVPAPR